MTKKRQAVKSSGRTRLSVNLPTDVRKRLGAYAAWHGRSESSVVESSVVETLRGFVISDRSSASAPSPAEPSPTIALLRAEG